jgi:hypothetical protein
MSDPYEGLNMPEDTSIYPHGGAIGDGGTRVISRGDGVSTGLNALLAKGVETVKTPTP